ncbi:hypothetical protein [Owenweeksia hongkongensis]|nr:hypothetical protein [Owenweeksia hongkongensis]
MEAKYYSFTTFTIKWWWMWPLFQWHGMMVTIQSKKTHGLLSAKVWNKKLRTYYTLTCWESKEQMLEFRNRKAHLKAMKIHRKLGETKSVSWVSAFEPYREECLSRLKTKHRNRVAA